MILVASGAAEVKIMVKLADLRRFGAYGIIVFVLMNISCQGMKKY